MTSIKFLNYVVLFSVYPTLLKSQSFKEYFSLLKFFPIPPGTEYMLSRSRVLDLGSPWTQDPTAYPLPNMPTSTLQFADAADAFGHSMMSEVDSGKQIYLMWSGGIDSTATAVSLLKAMQPAQRERLCVVASDMSLRENPMFYHRFLKDFDRIDLYRFDPAKIDLDHSIVIDGEGGDQTFGSSAANKLFSERPDLIHLPWRTNQDFLHQYWYRKEIPEFYDFFMHIMTTTIDQTQVPVESLFDFFWWFNFNFKFDSVMWRHTLRLSENITDADFPKFANQVCRRMYATDLMQQWSMSAGAEMKISTAKKRIKWAGRKYIYDFDRNEYYFREKRKEFSTQVTADSLTRYTAVDGNCQRHSIFSRAFRQDIGQKFYAAPQDIPADSTGLYVPIDTCDLYINQTD